MFLRFLGLSLKLVGCCCVRLHTTAELAANFLPRIASFFFFFFQAASVKLTDFKLSWMIWTRMSGVKTKEWPGFARNKRQKDSSLKLCVFCGQFLSILTLYVSIFLYFIQKYVLHLTIIRKEVSTTLRGLHNTKYQCTANQQDSFLSFFRLLYCFGFSVSIFDSHQAIVACYIA